MAVQERRLTAGASAALVLLLAATIARGDGLAPLRVHRPLGAEGPEHRVLSERTLVVGVEVDRDEARLVGYTVKPRPFVDAARHAPPRALDGGVAVQLEVELLGPRGASFVRRFEARPICLHHGPDAQPHVVGDTIAPHRESFTLELPEIEGFDRIEVGYYERSRGSTRRRLLGARPLDRARFDPAGRPTGYEQLAFARSEPAEAVVSPTASTVSWPEDHGDTEDYLVFGSEPEADERINVVIVPDGYTYAEKATMETHASDLVTYFRGKTPYGEHDPLINYVLVYAYSEESGTDQCDCGMVVDSAMGTRFQSADGNPCGHLANRCLYYGSSCDSTGTSNIVAAELRAPVKDVTLVMVNTTRYGGCGGARAVYSAGNGQAREIAVHELGHTLAGLADEYGGNPTCAAFANEINASSNGTVGAWPEWIEDLGAPVEGAQYYDSCLFRPEPNCEMRQLNQQFCPVCNQKWALTFYGHERTAPTAPLRSVHPAGPVEVGTGVETQFSVSTRLGTGEGVTHELTWSVEAPGDGEPQILAGGTPEFAHVFDAPGTHVVRCEVIADTNFVKPLKYGANVDTATWTVEVTALAPPGEISPPGSPAPLRFADATSLTWESTAAATTYNLYRGDASDLGGAGGACLASDLPSNSATDTGSPAPGTTWAYFVTGRNSVGEGTAGHASSGAPRAIATPCN
ncbi:MAG: hypothetical protein GY716_11095 [bacterium]|nr:hypothetical protein [bacterium]